jgi:hypothetical protein
MVARRCSDERGLVEKAHQAPHPFLFLISIICHVREVIIFAIQILF